MVILVPFPPDFPRDNFLGLSPGERFHAERACNHKSCAVPADSHANEMVGRSQQTQTGTVLYLCLLYDTVLAGTTGWENFRRVTELAESLPASCLRSIVAGGDLSGHWMVLSGAGTKGPDTLQV